MRCAKSFIALLWVICCPPVGEFAAGQCAPIELNELVADDGDPDDRFGFSLAANGSLLLVGAYPRAAPFPGGAAYLFEIESGKQIYKFEANDGEAENGFGVNGLALDGQVALIGAHSTDDNGSSSGSAYLFDLKTGLQLDKIVPADNAATDNFGFGVALGPNTAIITARLDDDNGTDSGSAYIYDTKTWEMIQKLYADDHPEDRRFGQAVAMNGDVAIVGAYRDDDNGDSSGSAYLFDATTWEQTAKLVPSDGEPEDWFGYSVAIDGGTAIVGAYRDDDNGDSSGSAYLFDVNTGQQLAKLLPDDGEPEDLFGFDVAIKGNIAMVSAHGDDDNGSRSGAVYLFDVVTGTQLAKFTAGDNAESNDFGRTLAISGTTAIISARLDDDQGLDAGSAYIFDISSCFVELGDINGDGEVNLLDVQPFVDVLTSGGFQAEADINQDGVVSLLDVDPFVALLIGG